MAELPIPTPKALERSLHPLRIGPERAEQIQRVDLMQLPGRSIRGKGQSRCSEVAVSTTTVRNGFVFSRPDCRLMLVDSTAGGKVRIHQPGYGGVIAVGCNGPAPDCTELFRDPDVTCDEGQDCATPADSSGTPYDIDWTITGVLAGGAFDFKQFPAVDKLVRACVGSADGKIYKPARTRNRVINNSGYCVLGQFRANIAGLSCGQLVKWRGNGDTGLPGSSDKAASVVIWSFCLENGVTLDWVVDWALTGQAADCGALARVNGFRAAYRCSPASPFSICTGSAPWNTLTTCAACP